MPARTKWKIVGISFGALVLVIGLIIGAMALELFGPRVTAPIQGRTDEITQTNAGGYRIAEYERFYRIREDVAAIDVKLASYPDGDLDRREETECRGLLANRANLVSEYNSASAAERTKGQWRDPELPEVLEQEIPRTC